MKKRLTLGSSLIGICMFFVLWQIAAMLLNKPIFPSPVVVVPLFCRSFGELGLHFLASTARVFVAVLLATVTAALWGLPLARCPGWTA